MALIADEIVEAINSYKNDERLKWYPDNSVRLLIGEVLPEGSSVKQTLEYRRKRLKAYIDERLLEDLGWRKIKMNIYKKTNDSVRVFQYVFKGDGVS